MIFVGGISGTGKTTALEKFVAMHSSFHHIKASHILKELGRPTIGVTLADLEQNQTVLREYLLGLSGQKNIIIDGHVVIPVHHHIYRISDAFFKDLKFQALILLWTEVDEIIERKNLSATLEMKNKLKSLQEEGVSVMDRIAKNLGCPFEVVDSKSRTKLEKALMHYAS